MWFTFPEGTTNISVQNQAFGVEMTGEDGTGFFRAPDHFAPIILSIPGFRKAEPPAGAPEDLPKADLLRDGAISELTATVEAQKLQIQNVTTDLGAITSRATALQNENLMLSRRLEQTEKELTDLRDQLNDGPVNPEEVQQLRAGLAAAAKTIEELKAENEELREKVQEAGEDDNLA